jgi:hypothetical protein
MYERLYQVAALQGYHVIGLTYPAKGVNCGGVPDSERLSCYGDYMNETVTGENTSTTNKLSKHTQDSLINRLQRVLVWAAREHPNDGWSRYFTQLGIINWTQIHLAGHSNGSSHASFMGTKFLQVERVSLFSGPNDGAGGTTEVTWKSPDYVQKIAGVTDTRYYGLVHVLNHADDTDPPPVYQVMKNWVNFGMEANSPRIKFDPDPSITTFDSKNAHMFISTDKDTKDKAAHNSVIWNVYCNYRWDDPDKCVPIDSAPIGYEPVWRCMLGTGDARVGSSPKADPGPDRTVHTKGTGASVVLDGSKSSDADCDVLRYTWSGSFGRVQGRNPRVFLHFGKTAVTLTVSDGWRSDEKKIYITVL